MPREVMSHLPVIEADQFVLRPLRNSDSVLIEHYLSNKAIAWMTSSIPYPYPPGAAREYIEMSHADDRGCDIWAIDASKSKQSELIGLIMLDFRNAERSPSLGYWIGVPFWGNGYATKATAALLEHNPHKNDTIYATVYQDNPASARVLTANGFQYLGDSEGFAVARGANIATWTYSRKLV